VLVASELPTDLQKQLYSYMFDTLVSARNVHEAFHAKHTDKEKADEDKD